MRGVVFIGDEISAAGYRLAGAAVLTPVPGDTAKVFHEACKSADVVMITAECAAHVPAERLDGALIAATPPVLVVEDAQGRLAPANLEDRVHAILGLEA